jgi:hypothetical protein
MIDSSYPILQFVVQDNFLLRVGHLVGVLRLLLKVLDKFKLPFEKRMVMTRNSSLYCMASPAATSFSNRVSWSVTTVSDAIMVPAPFFTVGAATVSSSADFFASRFLEAGAGASATDPLGSSFSVVVLECLEFCFFFLGVSPVRHK